MGPFYCPADQNVYLDLAFFDELAQRFGAPGDFAAAYVIAHEVGHHVQNLTGANRAANRMGSRGETSGSVRLELQADCYAGVWAARANARFQQERGQPLLETGDVEEGLQAANAIGDDTLQRQSGGRVAPDSFTHGSSAQRIRWFRIGLESGDPARCDTFNARQL
jgi:predicted metalloprotease